MIKGVARNLEKGVLLYYLTRLAWQLRRTRKGGCMLEPLVCARLGLRRGCWSSASLCLAMPLMVTALLVIACVHSIVYIQSCSMGIAGT